MCLVGFQPVGVSKIILVATTCVLQGIKDVHERFCALEEETRGGQVLRCRIGYHSAGLGVSSKMSTA